MSCSVQAWTPDSGPKPAPDNLDMKGKEIFFKLSPGAVCEPLVEYTLVCSTGKTSVIVIPLSEGEDSFASSNSHPFS